MENSPSVIAFVGESGSGKTSLLVETAPHLLRVGLRVAALKHTSGDFETSSPAGKDTSRYADAAIPSIGIISDSKFTFSRVHPPSPPSLADTATMYFRDADIVLVEGFKKE
ncbi:MAG: molybdopterin-guanine dinucleotide biosynthesis protein MobB, partial [Endomicrobiia bacterium]|nr:molybdopterin-guanine dinucleotide biosynthesis protein MobB [Endomicrobiia bacterium]